MEALSGFIAQKQHDLLHALEIVAQCYRTGEIPDASTLFSKEMIVLYIITSLAMLLPLRPVRRLLWRICDTLVALFMLCILGIVMLGIPFAIFFLTVKAFLYVGSALAQGIWRFFMGSADF